MMSDSSAPMLGFGLGLRHTHYPYIFEHAPDVDWFEIISENFMDTDGRPRRNLERIRERYPVVMHGVSLSIGTVDPINSEYLRKLKNLIDWVRPAWVSDHLCWTGVAHRNVHDLLPVPYTEEALAHIIGRIRQVQDYLGHPIALENPSTYLEFKSSSMPEAEFIARMAEESGCNLLLDVNNIYVTCFNHRLDPKAYIDAMPLDKVIQIHLAGHDHKGTHIVDTHDNHVADDVWTLYKYVVHKAGRIPNTMIEWDGQIPEFPVLYSELEKARAAAKAADSYGSLPVLCAPRSGYIDNAAPTLAGQQARMHGAVITGLDENPSAWIRDKAGFPPQAQLGVYIDAYRYRLYDVVAEDYPVLAHYLGAEEFNSLLWFFIGATPSGHFNIGRYAAALPAFVALSRPHDVFAQELCRLETTLAQLADARETPPLAAEALSDLTPDALMTATLQPREALELFAFTYPVNGYYRSVMEGDHPPPPALQASWLAVLRHDDIMWRAELEREEFAILKKLFSGACVGDALAQMDESAAAKLSRWFSRWMHHHLLSHIESRKNHVD